MKKLLAALLLLTGVCYADAPATIVRSSFTNTNDTVYISSSGYLTQIIVGSATTNGIIGVYNSTFSFDSASLISSISLNSVFTYDFSDLYVKGIFYKTTGNSNGVTILWKRR